MSAFNPRRFSKPETLRRIAPDRLLEFLTPYQDYLSARGVDLPAGHPDGLDYDALCQILLNPDSRTPQEMIEALFYIDQLSTQEGFDALQDAIADMDLDVHIGEDAAHADLAIQVWLKEPAILERLHAEQFLFHPRSFEYFRTTKSPVPPFEAPGKETIRALEHSLDDWFAKKRRGRTSRVFVFAKPDFVWFLVRHGEPFTREAAIREGESTSVHYRPEKFDVLVYDPTIGEIRMNARSKGEKQLYREKFGFHLFGSANYFDGESRFSLEPLRESGAASLICTDVDGMEEVKLKEIRFFRGGLFKEMEIRKAEDIFAAMQQRDASFPNRVPITRCTFEVLFSDSKTPRMVTISSRNKAQFKRDDDAVILETWMKRRGFIAFEEKDTDEAAVLAVAQA
ncbi:hypothetical protein KQH29_00935 [bacterium]|nr:hypothetical protein [bacterium]